MNNSIFNWNRFKGSFIYAFSGLWQVFKKEQNLWIMIIIAAVVVFLMFYLNVSLVEKTILVLVICGVLAAEILNTAIEIIFDKFHLDESENVKLAKNIMAGFVLLWSVGAVVVGLIIFWPYLF